MLTEALRQQLYRDLEKRYPLHRLQKETRARRQPAEPLAGTDLPLQRQRKFMRLKEQLQAQILLQLHTLFEFSVAPGRLQSAVEQAMQDLFVTEQACMRNGSYDASGCMLFLFRKYWFANLPSSFSRETGQGLAAVDRDVFGEQQPLALPALPHAQQAGFFTKEPLEVAHWTQRFLMLERYHRLDALEHENRLDRYRLLQTSLGRSDRQANWRFEDVMIWLEFRLLEESQNDEQDLGLLSRRLSEELGDCLGPGVLGDDPCQPFLYVMLKCHRFCLAETVEPVEHGRLQQLFANRQLDSILDLMRVVVYRTLEDHRLADTGTILDRLQTEGFNIEHQDFRDPYMARLVPLNRTEQLENCRLPLFLPIESLSGNFPQDMQMSRQTFQDWHQRIARQLMEECEAFALSQTQPLPQAHLLTRILRFAVTWALAELPWWPAKLPSDLPEKIRHRLPETALRQLVRPRKGYEVKSKKDLDRLLAAEIRRQWEPLQRIAETNRIQGYHDYSQFARYLALQHAQEEFGPGLDTKGLPLATQLAELVEPDRIQHGGQKWGIETRHSHPHTLESVRRYLTRAVALDEISPELEDRFESSEQERRQIYADLMERLVPSFYQLLVASERHRLELPRLPAELVDIPRLVRLLAPPLAETQELIWGSLKEDFENSAAALLRTRTRPYLLDGTEWEAYLAWETWNHTGRDIAHFLENGDFDQLLQNLERAAEWAEPAPGARAFATVQSTLLDLLAPQQRDSTVSTAAIQAIASLLPQLNCMACGRSSCRDFAASLLQGELQPQFCTHLAAHALPALSESLAQLKPAANGHETEIHMLDLLRDHRTWKTSTRRQAMRNVLAVTVQETRRQLLERLRSVWEQLDPKPQIFQCPDLPTLYDEFCRYMGKEAVERLSEAERDFLTEQGVRRQQAAWRHLKERQQWLFGAHLERQSRPLLQSREPAVAAANAYRNVFFLEQLHPADRDRVLQYRLERHQDGFSHWWNEDLLAMNLPDFSIRDWEDFAKVIKNAYWHQESSFPAADALAMLTREAFVENSSPRLLKALSSHLIELESARIAGLQQQLQAFRERPEENRLASVAELDQLIAALLAETPLAGTPFRADQALPRQSGITQDDQLTVDTEELWGRFQQGNFPVAAFLLQQIGVSPPERRDFIRDLMARQLRKQYQELAEVRWLENVLNLPPQLTAEGSATNSAAATGSASRPEEANTDAPAQVDVSFVPVDSVRLWIRHRLSQGTAASEVEAEVQELLGKRPELQRRFLDSVLHKLILQRQIDLLQSSSDRLSSQEESPADSRPGNLRDASIQAKAAAEVETMLFEQFPELRSFVDLLLKGHRLMDRERLFHYLFLLAKMEGNLDALTALLREIRETSDIMEAAWLRFTQDRILEGPPPKAMPGTTTPGIPLLASRIKDKGPVNRGLQEGVSRKEKRNVAAAVHELLSFIRFHVLLQAERGGDAQTALRELQNAGYDLSGIETESMQKAIHKQWERRAQLLEQKIWIYTSVTARRLAALHPELHEVERAFHKMRMDLLKGDAETEGDYQDVVGRRGVALGQIKEEVYRQLSDLLEKERMETFQKRIRQIVAQLDQKRREIYSGWLNGEVNRRTLFYLLRQYQKRAEEPGWEDFQRFLREHWFLPLEELRSARRPDAEERIQQLDAKFRALLGVSLLELETESREAAEREQQAWTAAQLAALEEGF